MKLNELADNYGARKTSKRVGRGIGSGKGKTSGSGVKGQKSRSGVAVAGFEGGQMPIYRRLPKRGFTNLSRITYQEINTGRVQQAIDEGKIDAATPITAEILIAAGVIRRELGGLRLLGSGEISAKIAITVAGATKSAIAAVEAAGGSVTVTNPAPAAEAAQA